MYEAPRTGMRDEIKSAIFCLILVLLPVFLFALFHPEMWKSTAHAVPLPSAAHRFSDALPPSQFDEFVARYGPATFEEHSAHGTFRPPLFTKWLDYEPEHLRVAFVAAESSTETSGRDWILISFVDAERTVPISPTEAAKRLMKRQK